MGFWEDIVDMIKYRVFNIRTPELEQKMKIQDLKARLKAHHPPFINFRINGVSAQFANFMFQIYKAYGTLGKYLKKDFETNEGKEFARYLIDKELTKEQKQYIASFQPDAVRKRIIEVGDVTKAFNAIKTEFKAFQESFDPKTVEAINKTYNLLKAFGQLADFDFYLFLRTFDTNLPENNYDYRPAFEAKENMYLIDDLMRLDGALLHLPLTKELVDALHVYDKFHELPPMGEKRLKPLLGNLKHLQRTGILTDMILFLSKDLQYIPESDYKRENVMNKFFTELSNQMKDDMEAIIRQLKEQKVKAIKERVFNGIQLSSLNNYNENKSRTLTMYRCEPLKHVEPLLYLKTFVLEKYEREMKETFNNILIQTEFVVKERQVALTDAFYRLVSLREMIVGIDAKMADEGEEGKRLKGLTLSITKNPGNKDLANKVIERVDNLVLEVIKDGLSAFATVGEILGSVVDDCKTKKKKEIYNGKELLAHSPHLVTKMETLVGDIRQFITLMKNFVRM